VISPDRADGACARAPASSREVRPACVQLAGIGFGDVERYAALRALAETISWVIAQLQQAEREALCGERLRRSAQPSLLTPMLCSCSHSPSCGIAAGARRPRPRTRAQNDAVLPHPGRRTVIAPTVEQVLTTARASAGISRLGEELSAAELAVLRGLATGLSRREYISLHTVKPRTGEVVPQARRNIARGSASRRSARPASAYRITRVIRGPHGPNRDHGEAC
jgi:hypothetical protein